MQFLICGIKIEDIGKKMKNIMVSFVAIALDSL